MTDTVVDGDSLPLEERVKIPGLAVWSIEQMTDIAQVKRVAQILRDALSANLNLLHHTQHVLGGWEKCAPCQAANDQCDSSLVCDRAKGWLRQIDAAWRIS